ncbi:uncharacterized protein LOC126612016 isoform X1 [Malus sylvestris]|uniref:uncharacterized protein LOC126612016 isoform X1 n=1 Tax=Malus sylvestris TaxID=3752 RepID=UPI0021AC64AA|nr:uncharacterized protein LOC126612016 isoform X1 [Malus sylvestris]
MWSEGEVPVLGYWLQWQVLVCALIIAAPATVALKFAWKGKPEPPLKSVELWGTCWRTLDPLWLLFYRAFAFVLMAKLLFDMTSQFGLFTLVFYTQWTFALVMLYFGLGTIISAHGCWVGRSSYRDDQIKGKVKPKSNQARNAIQQRAGFFGNLMLIIYQTCAGAVMLTDIVFWCLILPFLTSMEFQLTFLIGAIHALNAVFLIVDTALNRLPFSKLGFAYFALFGVLYISFQWLIHAFGVKWWPYPFLELNTPLAPLWYFGLAVWHIPCYWIYSLIINSKVSILPRLFPRSFLRS